MKRSLLLLALMMCSFIFAGEIEEVELLHGQIPVKIVYILSPDKPYYEKNDVVNISATFTYLKGHKNFVESEIVKIKIEQPARNDFNVIAEADSFNLTANNNVIRKNWKVVFSKRSKAGCLTEITTHLSTRLYYNQVYLKQPEGQKSPWINSENYYPYKFFRIKKLTPSPKKIPRKEKQTNWKIKANSRE